MNIAVYGTLKKGFGNHGYLSNSELICVGETKEKFAMYKRGIPFVVKDEKISNIKVEVYKVDKETLRMLDALEGHPAWYKREPLTIISNDGDEIEAELYFNDLNESEKEKLILVENGNY